MAADIQRPFSDYTPHISGWLDGILAGVPQILPELILAAAFILAILAGLLTGRLWRGATYFITLAGIIGAAAGALTVPAADQGTYFFSGMLVADQTAIAARLLIAAACLLFVVFVQHHKGFSLHTKGKDDLFCVLLAVQIGLNLMVLSVSWLMVYIAIEMVSVGSYIMVGYLSAGARNSEASMKYVLFGAVCSAVMLYGISLLYGFTGSMAFADPAHLSALADMPPVLLLTAMLFVFTGVGFKLSFAPFHFWTPDVYQGAPTPVTAFLSTAPKIAAVVLFSRLLFAWPAAGIPFPDQLLWLLILAATGTMLLGNLAALRQENVKRMMAYSSIGHTGFLMMAVLAYPENAYQVVLFYLAVYLLMNVAVFMLTDYVEEQTGAVGLEEYKGLGRRYPLAFTSFVWVLISLTGLPPTAGFVAKLIAFSAVYDAWHSSGHPGMLLMLITGALTTVISLFYYFKIPLNAFLRGQKSGDDVPVSTITGRQQAILYIAVILALATLLFGLFPQWMMELL